MPYSPNRLIAPAAALITLAVMLYMARPWGDHYAYQSFSGYVRLLGFAVWAILPYLMILFLTPEASSPRSTKLLATLGALIISLGGVALYLDAALGHPDPQGGLVFVIVPCYQWLILALWGGLHLFFRKSQTP